MTGIEISRRNAMLMAGGLPVLMALPVSAQTAVTGQPPAFPGRAHKIKLGQFEVTTLLGGQARRDDPAGTFALGVDPAEFSRVSQDNFLPEDWMGNSFTMTLVKTPDALILFDTGLNVDPTNASLAMAGYNPGDVTHVVLTHMHGDHIGGLMAGDQPNFPNAQLIYSRNEYDYWAENSSDAYTAKVAPLVGAARMVLSELDTDEVAPGIHAEAAYGHTPGHTIYSLESEGQKLLITGDSFNHYAYSVQHPEWHVRFDIDKEMAVTTRGRVLSRLADERIPFIGYHMPYPAIGYIARTGTDAFRYSPATYQFMAEQ